MAEQVDLREQLLNGLIDEVVTQGKSADDLLGENGIVKQLTKRVLGRMLWAEVTDRL